MKSATLIIPETHLSAGNALGEAMGWGPGNYSVALSPNGSPPATHYGCRADVSDGFLAMMANPPASAIPVLAVLVADFRETSDPFGHFQSVISALGLQVVQRQDA